MLYFWYILHSGRFMIFHIEGSSKAYQISEYLLNTEQLTGLQMTIDNGMSVSF